MNRRMLRVAVFLLMGGATLSFVSCNKDFEQDLDRLEQDMNSSLEKQNQALSEAISRAEENAQKYADAAEKAAKEYAENVAKSEAATAKADAIAESNNYTDKEIKEALAKAIEEAKAYSEKALASAKDYTDSKVKESVEAAKLDILTQMSQKCQEILTESKKYTDDQIKAFKEDLKNALEGKFEKIDGDINLLKQTTETLKNNLSELQGSFETFRETVNDHMEYAVKALDDLQTRLGNAEADIEHILSDIKEMKGNIKGLTTVVNDHIEKMKGIIEGINTTLAEHSEDIAALQNEIINVRSEMAAMEEAMKALIDKKINDLRTEMTTLVDNTVEQLTAAIEAAKKEAEDNANSYTDEQVTVLKESIGKLEEQLSALQTAFTEFQNDANAKFDDIFTRLIAAETNITTIQGVLENYGIRLDGIDSRIDKLVEDFNKSLTDLATRLDADIDDLKTSMLEEMGKLENWLTDVEAKTDANTTMIEELRNSIDALSRKHMEDVNDLQKAISDNYDKLSLKIDEVAETLLKELNCLKAVLTERIKQCKEDCMNYTDEQVAILKGLIETMQEQLTNCETAIAGLEEYKKISEKKFTEISGQIVQIESVLKTVSELAQANKIRLDGLDEAVANLSDKITAVETQLKADITTVKADLLAKYEELLGKIQAASDTAHNELTTEINALKDIIATLATSEDLDNAVATLRSELNTAIKNLEAAVNAKLETMKAELMKEMTAMKAQLYEYISLASKQAEANANTYTDKQIAAVNALITALDSELQALQTQTDMNTQGISNLFLMVNDLTKRMVVVEAYKQTLEDYGIRITNLETDVAKLQKLAKKYGVSIKKLVAEVDLLKKGQQDILGEIAGLKNRAKALEDAVKANDVDIETLFKAMANVHHMFTERITSMQFIPEMYTQNGVLPVMSAKSFRYIEKNVTAEGTILDKGKVIRAFEDLTVRYNVAPSNVEATSIASLEVRDQNIEIRPYAAEQKPLLSVVDYKINENRELEVVLHRNPSDIAYTNMVDYGYTDRMTVALKANIAEALWADGEKNPFVISDYITYDEVITNVKLLNATNNEKFSDDIDINGTGTGSLSCTWGDEAFSQFNLNTIAKFGYYKGDGFKALTNEEMKKLGFEFRFELSSDSYKVDKNKNKVPVVATDVWFEKDAEGNTIIKHVSGTQAVLPCYAYILVKVVDVENNDAVVDAGYYGIFYEDAKVSTK